MPVTAGPKRAVTAGPLDVRIETPLGDIARHLDHLLEKLGEDGVALGSDYDGAQMPEDLADASMLQNLTQAMLAHGYDRALVEKIAWKNWLSVLERTWGA